MHQPYRNLPRIDDPAPMLARLHWQDLYREAEQARLAKRSGAARTPFAPRLAVPAWRVWHTLCVSIGREVLGRGVGMPADQMVPAVES